MSEPLEARLSALERSVRRWRAATWVAVVLGLVSFVWTARGMIGAEVRAYGFALVNQHGDVVARLEPDGQGDPRLTFTLAKAKGKVVVGALGEDIAGFTFLGNGVTASLSVDSEGDPAVSMSAGDRKAIFSVANRGSPALLMTSGRKNLWATTDELRIKDESGNLVFATENAKSAARR